MSAPGSPPRAGSSLVDLYHRLRERWTDLRVVAVGLGGSAREVRHIDGLMEDSHESLLRGENVRLRAKLGYARMSLALLESRVWARLDS